MNIPKRRSRTLLSAASLTLALIASMGLPAHAIAADHDTYDVSPKPSATTSVSTENPFESNTDNPQASSASDAMTVTPSEEGMSPEKAVTGTPIVANSQPVQPQNEAPQNDALTPFASITMERVDANKDDSKVYVGDILEWDITYTNKTSDATLSFLPTQATIENTAIVGSKGYCRWGALAPQSTAHCRGRNNAIFQVTASHLGQTITPEVTFTVKKGNEVIVENYVVRGTPFTVHEGKRLDPSEVPTPRVDGVALELARNGKAGFTCYRIPALTTAPNGDLLAAWDGRPDSCADAPNPNSIVQRVSKDGGQSWSAPVSVASGMKGYAKYGYSDPSYVVDHEANKVFMFFVKSYDVTFFASQPGTEENQRNVLHAAVMESTDNGASWGPIRTITAAITSDPAHMRSRFAASGEGIQLRHPSHKGRLIQQFTYAITQPQGPEQWKAVSVYSDDHGATWKAGEPVGAGMDENKVVELSDGTIMLNSRASGGGAPGVKARRVAYSHDGGHSYGDVTIRYDLVDQNNNAGLTRAFPDVPADDWRAKVVLFTNTANANARSNGTVKVSYDDGKTWAVAKEFYSPHTGYSTITPLKTQDGTLNSGRYGILFEKDASGISYMQVSDEWLDLYRAFPGGEERAVKRGGNIVTFTVENRAKAPLTGATLTAHLPEGWKLVDAPDTPLEQAMARAQTGQVTLTLPEMIAVGEKITVAAKVLIPADENAGTVRIPLTLTDGVKETMGALTLTVELDAAKGEKPHMCQDNVRITNNPPSETVREPAHFNNMLDGNPSTFWHTPWSSITVPVDVDFTVKRTEGLKELVLTNRSDSKNGRLMDGTLSVVDNGTVLPLATLSNVGDSTIVSLEGLAQYVELGQSATLRLHITGTDAGTPSQRNTVASLAELCAREVYPSRDLHDELPALPLGPSTPIPPATPPVQELPETLSVAQGEEIRIEMPGFAPTQEVNFEVHSDPVFIGTSSANAEGVAALTWRVPVDFPPGSHTLVARANDKEIRQKFIVAQKSNDAQTPGTPSVPNASGSSDSKNTTPANTTQTPAASQANEAKLARTGTTLPSVVLGALILAGCGLVAYRVRRQH